jgi:hypothetical protein
MPQDLQQARLIAEEAATRIAQVYGEPLAASDVARIAAEFRAKLAPRERRRGRKRSSALNAAFADWKSGMTGNALFVRHIPRYSTMSRWRRLAEQRKLMNSLYSRARRDRESEFSQSPGSGG